MTIDKAQLRGLAEACEASRCADEEDEGRRLSEFHSELTPEAMLELLAEIDQLKLALDMESAELAWSDSDGRAIQAERDQLKAELAGLRTGYDAQNNVIAGLKAEGVSLRKALSECLESLAGELAQKYGDQKPEAMHPVTRRSYDSDMSELAGYQAAMAKESSHG